MEKIFAIYEIQFILESVSTNIKKRNFHLITRGDKIHCGICEKIYDKSNICEMKCTFCMLIIISFIGNVIKHRKSIGR